MGSKRGEILPIKAAMRDFAHAQAGLKPPQLVAGLESLEASIGRNAATRRYRVSSPNHRRPRGRAFDRPGARSQDYQNRIAGRDFLQCGGLFAVIVKLV